MMNVATIATVIEIPAAIACSLFAHHDHSDQADWKRIAGGIRTLH
jgi:hypothetical protein